MGASKAAQENIEIVLGAALLLGAAAMVLRYALDRRGAVPRTGVVRDMDVHLARTVAIGMVGRLIVGMTSVGSGSLMIILLLFLYPTLGRQPAGGHRPQPGGAADARRRARRAGFRTRRLRCDGLADHRQRAGGCDRLAAVGERARPLHQAGDHVRHLRLRSEVRWPRNDRARLGAVRDPAGSGRGLAGSQPSVGTSERAGRPRRDRGSTARDQRQRLALAHQRRYGRPGASPGSTVQLVR